MPEVRKFDKSMIEEYLRSRNYRFLRDNEDDFVLQYAYSDDSDCKVTIFLMSVGTNDHILSVVGKSDKAILKPDWGRVVMLCNTWNREKRWPKSYLYVEDATSSNRGEIMLEEHIDLEKGIHQELLDGYIFNACASIHAFWEWIHKEHGV